MEVYATIFWLALAAALLASHTLRPVLFSWLAARGERRRAQWIRDRELAALASHVQAVGGVLAFHDARGLEAILTSEGRTAWVQVETEEGKFALTVSIAVDAALDLEIRRPRLSSTPRRTPSSRFAIPVATGDQPDARVAVRRAHDDEGAVADRLFAHAGDGLTDPLARILYLVGADAVVARGGRLSTSIDVREGLLAQATELLSSLAQVALAYVRRPALPAIGELAERYLWLEGNAPRCPYCHVDLTPEEPALVSCERCRTIHHDACFRENGRCTLLGCGGKAVSAAPRAPA